jgi:hypothetical protein
MAVQPAPIPVREQLKEHGEVFTRRWVVELILDLVGYTADRDLVAMKAIEPACGSGAFLVPMIERLLASADLYGRDLSSAHNALCASDLVEENSALSREAASETLGAGGVPVVIAEDLASAWIRTGDFLLDPPPERSADFVVGNPPYVRLEAVARDRSDAYRLACRTMGGRADVYVGFYEHGLRALRDGTALGFICPDRWMRNAYGARLRAMVSEGWSVETVISMTGVDAFQDEVDAYPSITILRRAPQEGGPLFIEGTPLLGPDEVPELLHLASQPDSIHADKPGFRGARLRSWFSGPAGWPHGSPDRLEVIADLEEKYEPLEDPATGTKLGIGVATGADGVFITEDRNLVEPDRLLPLVLPRDIASGKVEWSGKYLVNPWGPDGLIEMEEWPQFSAYVSEHRALLEKRHTAKKGRWHKTIDRVIEGLSDREKLYLPDFKETIFPVLDAGSTYPHHNLYWVISDGWDLRVLGGLLLSDVASLFIEAYSVRMRGGFLRFQAQYLRRIRVPSLDSIDSRSATALADAFERRDRHEATRLALPLYGLDDLPKR